MKRMPPVSSSPPNPSPLPLPRRAARIVHFEPGSHWKLGSALVRGLGVLAPDRVLVRPEARDRIETVGIDALEPDGTPAPASAGISVERYSKATWAKALREHAQITVLLERPDRSTHAQVAQA